MTWLPSSGPCHDYYWHHSELPNGWSPSVSDMTQACAPRQTTEYRIAAVSKYRIVQGPTFDTLAEAKREAILLAMAQAEEKR